MTASTDAAPSPLPPAYGRLGALSVAAWLAAAAMAVFLGSALLAAGEQRSWPVLAAASLATLAFAGIGIASRSAAASALQQTRLLACLDSSREGQLIADFDGRISFVNATARRLLNTTQSQAARSASAETCS